MHEILRVPPGPGHTRKAYDYIMAFLSTSYRQTFNEFYSSVKSVYMIAENNRYYGMGWIYLKDHSYLSTMVKIRPYGDAVYSLNVLVFNNDSAYIRVFDLIKTLIKDCADRTIIAENISIDNKDIINALKNNGFKAYKNTNQYSTTFYKIPNGEGSKKFNVINPRDDLHTIDKHICLCDKPDMEAEAIEKYTKELLENNLANTVHNSDGCGCGCDNCNCNIQLQTEEEFLGTSICCKENNNFCEC